MDDLRDEMSEDAHTEMDGFTRLPISGWRCDHCGALTHIPDDHAARCSKRIKTSVYPPDSSTLYLETRCPDCDRLKGELAAAREELHGISCRHESSIRLMRNQNEELIKMLAKRPLPTLLVDKSDSAELAKLRKLCAEAATVIPDSFIGPLYDIGRRLAAAGRGEGTNG